MSTSPSILLVCTGNICRSPAAQLLMEQSLAPATGTRFRSAGTLATPGQSIAGPMASLLDDLGLHTNGFRSQRLSRDLIARSDLILTMSRQHRSSVVALEPAALKRTFTLTEFARILSKGAPSGVTVTDLAEWAASQRSPAGAGRLERTDDITDPYGKNLRVYRQSLDQVRSAVDVVTDALLAA